MKILSTIFVSLILLLTSCKKDDSSSSNNNNGNNNNNGANNNTGALGITSTSPKYVFWGDELTVNGKGFSNNKAENIVYITSNQICAPGGDSTWRKAEVVSASTTKLVVKVPYFVRSNGLLCGADYGYVKVSVNNKWVTADSASRFVGPPIMNLCHPFGVTINSAPPNTYRPGDSSVMTVRLQTLYTRESGYYDKLKLYVNGTLLNTVDKTWPGATCGGLTFVLDADKYSDLTGCTLPQNYNYGPARKMTFVVKVDGTSYADTTEEWVLNHPKTAINGSTGPTSVSKSAGGNPYVKVQGKFMYFNKIRWVTTGEPDFHTSPPGHDLKTTELNVFIPLSVMVANKAYRAIAVNYCGDEMELFSISVTP